MDSQRNPEEMKMRRYDDAKKTDGYMPRGD